jgi:hypothetical protein
MYLPPASPPYLLGGYLREAWGINVQTNYLVIPAVADETLPGKFKIDPIRSYPVSNFQFLLQKTEASLSIDNVMCARFTKSLKSPLFR